MSQKPLKELSNPQEISSHLTHAALKRMKAHIWKRNYEGQVWLNEKVTIVKVIDNSYVRVEFESDVELNVGSEVFFALEGGKLVFKSYVIESKGRRIMMALPTIAKGIERRRSPRKKFKLEEYIDFEFEAPGTERATAYLLDLSLHGICLTFSDETVKKLELNQEITLLRTNAGVTHTRCIVRSIRIFRQGRIGRNALYAVGMEFVREVSNF